MRNEIMPQPGAQMAFLASSADIVIYGGAAGGGKSYGLLMEALRHVDKAFYGGVIFRRTYSDITNQGGLWDESSAFYPLLRANPNQTGLYWEFPSGGVVSFAHLQHDADVQNYQGAQMPFIGFDELTHFSERQFFYLLSRNRLGQCAGFQPYVRATCNPDADSWVAEFISWWIADDGYADLSRAGKLRYFYRHNNVNYWSDTPEELKGRFPEKAVVAPPKSVTFIPATVYDNKILLEKDPSYLGNLQSLDNIDQQRLLGDKERGGNWKIRAEAGKFFNRAWFGIEEAPPSGGVLCRGWDFAATVQELRGSDPDFTAGVLLLQSGGLFYVLDVYEDRVASVDDVLKNTAPQDCALAARLGASYLMRWEIEPASASIRESARLVLLLAGYDVAGVRVQGDKLTRAKALAAQARAGNVKLVRGAWNEAFLKHLHGQPDLKHDDVMDAVSLAFNAINAGVTFGFAVA